MMIAKNDSSELGKALKTWFNPPNDYSVQSFGAQFLFTTIKNHLSDPVQVQEVLKLPMQEQMPIWQAWHKLTPTELSLMAESFNNTYKKYSPELQKTWMQNYLCSLMQKETTYGNYKLFKQLFGGGCFCTKTIHHATGKRIRMGY